MSSGSESDEEYVPGEPEQVSEEGSADEETDLQFEKELEYKTKKRKATKDSKGKKKRRTRNGVQESVSEEEDEKIEVPKEKLNPEEEKKHEDDLWAKFLEGTDTKPKTSAKVPNAVNEPAKSAVNVNKEPQSSTSKKKDDDNAREKRIFEFAGETIVVENNVIKEKIKTADSPATGSKPQASSHRGRAAGGLSNILGQLNKTGKLSTLEKSKLDWVTYKKEEGIEEEIESHNKGKSGYLDRQDFLERADLRQYEIERDLRTSRRSNR